MKGVRLLIILLMLVGVVWYYQNNSEFKLRIDDLLDIQSDSVSNVANLDSINSPERSVSKHIRRERIPKEIKPDKYFKLDQYARNTPEKYARKLADLAKYLSIPAKNDLEKARLAFTWVATHVSYDAEAFSTGNYKNESADSVLERRSAVCDGYSTLFKELVSQMGIEVEKIVGYAKGFGDEKGAKFNKPDHAWNAIKLNNNWQLIDVTWASGYVSAKNNKLISTMQFDPYWFCVSPGESIFTHLPEDEKWQLSQSPITLTQFENLPGLDGSFFSLGFDNSQVFGAALSGEVTEFAESYSIDFPVTKIELPFTKQIEQGKEYSFVLESPYAEEMAIIEDGRCIKNTSRKALA